MRVPWKIVGLAGVAGVAASGVVVVRRRRGHQDYDPVALREKLHERLAETRAAPAPDAGDGAANPRPPPRPRPRTERG